MLSLTVSLKTTSFYWPPETTLDEPLFQFQDFSRGDSVGGRFSFPFGVKPIQVVLESLLFPV
jgi:hypothetical protein